VAESAENSTRKILGRRFRDFRHREAERKEAPMRWMLALAVLGGGEAEPDAWVFVSPDSPDASGLFRALEGRKVRAVLLTDRLAGPAREPSEAFLATIAAAGELRVVDEEGLRMAERLGIRELPAVAVRRDGRFHVAAGAEAPVKELLSCSR
jgi:hypothetical protein